MLYGIGGTRKNCTGERRTNGSKKLVKKGPHPRPPVERVDYKFPNEAGRVRAVMRHRERRVEIFRREAALKGERER